MPIAARRLGASFAFLSAARAQASCVRRISMASCSTQRGCGKCWRNSFCASALAAGTPVAYGRIVEWKGRPEADIFWGGESALFDKLAEQKQLARRDLPKSVVDSIPDSSGKPKPIPLKDPNGYWIGTVLEPYGLVYHPKLYQ